MSRTSQKCLEGENGVRNFLSLWYPEDDPNVVLPVRARSKGVNDSGDIDSVPYTCIEVKNHENPVVGTLLDNAEWKSRNAGKRIWFLAYKRTGYSENRAAFWHTCMTVSGLINAYNPIHTKTQSEMTLESVPDLCQQQEEVLYDIGFQVPEFPVPEKRWRLLLKFRSYMSRIDEQRSVEVDAAGHSLKERIITMVISPRRDRDADQWYAYTNLAGQARMLETCGVLRQYKDEYPDHDNADEEEVPA